MSSVLLLSLILAMSADPAALQRKAGARTATLAVLVSDPAGTPIGNVKVIVEGPAVRTSRTEGGRIVFEELPPGAYRLRFEHEAFTTLERELTARAGAPIDVKVTLSPAPVPEPPPVPEPAPAPAAPAVDATPVTLDMPAVIEQEFVGRAPGKTTALACATGGSATLIQLRDPLDTHAHADADEFVYVIAGEGSARLDGREQRLRAGVFMLVPRGVPHTFAATGRNPLMVLSTLAGELCAGR